MGLFNSRPLPAPLLPARLESAIPVTPLDVAKWYDVYCVTNDQELVYENVRFVGIRTFGPVPEYSSGLHSGFLEIEAVDGSRILIQSFGIRLLCEHGTRPTFRVLRQRGDSWNE